MEIRIAGLVGAVLFCCIVYAARSGHSRFILDAALLAGAILTPRPLLACLSAALMVAVRHVPVLATPKANALPPWLRIVLLPGARHERAPVTGVTQPLTPKTLDLRSWLNWANHTETAPHLAVTGPTRAGKTTLILSVLGDRAGDILVCTPKPAAKDPWGGIGAVRLGQSSSDITYAPIADAVRQVYDEMLRRNLSGGLETPLTLVVDDYSTVVAEKPEIRPWVLRMWTMAASASIRLIVIDTEENVKAWGIEGRGDARGNLVFMRVMDDRSATMRRWGQTPTPIDTRQVKRLADQVRLDLRSWSGLSVWSPPAVCVEADSAPIGAAQTQTDSRPTADDDLIEYLMARSYTREQARTWLAPRGMGLDNNRWRDIAARRKTAAPAV